MKAQDIKEMAVKRAQAAPELAKQIRDRSRKKVTDINAVDRRVHTSRKVEMVESKEVKRPTKRQYMEPSHLPGMPEIPGYHLEYVRRDNRGRGDYANLSAHLRSGWEFARKSDFANEHLPTVRLDQHGDCIGNDDTVLMKIEDEMWAQRNEIYNTKRDKTTRAINRKIPTLDVSHPHMPLFQADIRNETEVSMPRVGFKRQGTKVAVAED